MLKFNLMFKLPIINYTSLYLPFLRANYSQEVRLLKTEISKHLIRCLLFLCMCFVYKATEHITKIVFDLTRKKRLQQRCLITDILKSGFTQN